MTIARRRLLQALALAGVPPAEIDAQATTLSVEALRNASLLHGIQLSDQRLEVVKPVVERRLAQLKALRDFAVEDAVGPTEGILVK
jgi:hypothetical protein